MLKNQILLWCWQILTLFPVPTEQIRRNTADNLRLLQAEQLIEPDAYIEDQPRLSGLMFGKHFNFSYSGCTVIAVYNTMRSMGQQVSKETLCQIAEELQRRGVALGGKFGVAPLSLKQYMKRKGFVVRSTVSTKAEVLDALGEESDTVLAVVWNGKRLRDQLHAVNIERRGSRYIIHNSGYLMAIEGGCQKFVEKGVFDSLSEAVAQTSSKGARTALVLGIRGRQKQAAGGKAETVV